MTNEGFVEIDVPAAISVTVRYDNEDSPEFHQAFGEMVLNCAEMERLLYCVLVFYAGVTNGVGRAVFSGLNADKVIHNIKAIFNNTHQSPERDNDLKFLFAQITHLRTLRDIIAHHGSVYPNEWIEEKKARKVTKINRSTPDSHLVNSVTLNQMTGDLLQIRRSLQQHLTKDVFSPFSSPDARPTTWLYKPQPQEKMQASMPRNARRRERPPRSPQK